MKTIVVLGGSGFVGRHLCPALGELGHRVVSVSRSPLVAYDPRVEYVDCNFDNIYQLGELYQQADIIFHLAWDTTPATSSRQSSLEVTANLLPSLRLLEYLEHHCHALLVYVSSGGTIYGDLVAQRMTESRVPSPISYYGSGKASVELFLQAYHRQSGNAVVILRPSNIYGPGQLARQQFGVVPTVLNALLHGTTFTMLGDGEQQRDFLYIDDFVALCGQLAKPLANGDQCVTLNVGSGEAISLNTLVRMAEEVTGRSLALKYSPARKVDVRSVVLDCERAKRDFGWHATTELAAGFRQTWDWLRAS